MQKVRQGLISSAFDNLQAIVALDDWLNCRAMSNQLSGASRCFVVLDEQTKVRGYYAMAAGAVAHQLAAGNMRRNMPDPTSVLVLGVLQ